MYRQPGLLYTPQNFAQSSKFLGNFFFFSTKFTSKGILKHFPEFEGHTSSGSYKRNFELGDETLIFESHVDFCFFFFFGARSWLCCAPIVGLTKNIVKQNCSR
jgi:hypothetical protein